MSARPQTSRLSAGERTRRDILEVATRLAALEGLEGLTIGRLAAQLGMSKAGLFAHFGSKVALQLATVETAYGQFEAEVAAVALAQPPGLEQLRTFMDAYFDYVARRVDTGGCFFTAASLEMDDRPGPVRDLLAQLLSARNLLARGCLEEAVRLGELGSRVEPAQLAFEVVALAAGANLDFQLTKSPEALERARAALRRWLAENQARTRKRSRAKR